MKNNVVRRAVTSAAAASTLAASLLAGGIANAQGVAGLPSGNYVAFGDSFAANPNESAPTAWSRSGCSSATDNIGSHIAAQTGLELHDYACAGTNAFTPNEPRKTLLGQVDDAIARGSLGPNTQLVTVFVGANDIWRNPFMSPADQDRLYHVNVVQALNKIKAANSTARIMLIGYPAFTSADPVHYACPINANGFAPRIPAAGLHDIEMALQNRQIAAANETQVGFVNMKEIANIDVAMCGRDGERQVSAILDTDTATYYMTNHPTIHGSRVAGTTIANVYKSTF
ncbi:GDSL-type esterase/lipase family protein [uncultured Corynebacterium sp.]|uniref:GDSL-type esterase/lipase family protein n=1 Tax=uncultured Corynebacterium sp. TaxID=159447 RepID=UPI00260D4374|nr:GDSL-type esterase/lipase family protein [uncultured Corynebacterium sp.]